jgi:hypothetical protein
MIYLECSPVKNLFLSHSLSSNLLNTFCRFWRGRTIRLVELTWTASISKAKEFFSLLSGEGRLLG